MRCATLLLVLLGLLAMAFAVQHGYEAEVDEFALVETDAEADAESGLELEAEADAEADAEAESEEEALVETEAEVDAEAEAEAEAEEELDLESETELEAEAEEELEAEAEPAHPFKTAPYPDLTQGMVILPIGGAQTGPHKYTKEAAYKQTVISKPKPQLSGWALRQSGAPAPVNITDVYVRAFDSLKTGCKSVVNVTEHLKVREYSYLLVPGFGAPADQYFAPLVTALQSYGVHPLQIVQVKTSAAKATTDIAASVYAELKALYTKYRSQPVVLVAHGIGLLPVHAMLALNPDASSFIHGLVALNPVWGGSFLADATPKSLGEDVVLELVKAGFNAASSADISHKNRAEFIKKYPVDYNQLRVLSVATHSELADSDLAKSIKAITGKSNEINDGVSTISDQLIPGGRAIILDRLDHNDLIVTDVKAPVNSTLAAQAYIYSFFKTTP